ILSLKERLDLLSDGTRSLDYNHYTNKKSAAETMLDVALLMANASQLKAVIHHGPSLNFYYSLITLISISIVLQVVVAILLILIVRYDLNKEKHHVRLQRLEDASTVLILVIVIVNIFITAFGVQHPVEGTPNS
uniref:Ninjurin 2 n=1 Tax=Leptobrachium leishanense TaxID=445787 RepID=A0A8C5R194_9ANUR